MLVVINCEFYAQASVVEKKQKNPSEISTAAALTLI